MNKEEAIELLITTKGISAFSRNAIEWFYKNKYVILSPKEIKFYTKILNKRRNYDNQDSKDIQR